MTDLAAVEADLAALPPSPETMSDIRARAALARRRLDLIEAARIQAAVVPPISALPSRPGMVTLLVPHGVSCVEIGDRRHYVEEFFGDWPLMFMPPGDAFKVLTAAQAGEWIRLNGDVGAHPHMPQTMFSRLSGAPL